MIQTSNIDPESLANLAATVARAAGERILALREQGVSVAATKSSDIDVVTESDRECERMVVEMLTEARPDDGVLGEEGAGRDGTSGIVWIIDPIDGTVNYLYDLPAYTVSIAATVADPEATAEGRRSVAGAVYNPRTDEMFEAWEGGGARRNGETLRVSAAHDFPLALVGTGFAYTVERKVEQLEVLTRLLPQIRDIRRIGCASYDLCLVASGHLDGFYEVGLNPWDYGAGVVIAREAGVELLGLDDATPPGSPLLVAAAPGLVRQLRDTIVGSDA